jgi:hypothetical protein
MIKFLAGIVVGIVIATVGVSGITRMLDNGVEQVKTQTQEMAR